MTGQCTPSRLSAMLRQMNDGEELDRIRRSVDGEQDARKGCFSEIAGSIAPRMVQALFAEVPNRSEGESWIMGLLPAPKIQANVTGRKEEDADVHV